MAEPAIKVLLIDDDEEDFFLTQDLLEEVGKNHFEVHWKSSFADGLEALCSADYDICLLDYRLGAQTGLDLLRAAKERSCIMPVIILTGQSEREIDFTAMELGAADFLEKKDLTGPILDRAIRYTLLQHKHSELLECQVKERTQDLELANRSLKEEIHQRHLTHTALLESEERFRHLADAMPQIVWICDPREKIEFINRQWCMYTGLSPEESGTVDQFEQVIHPDDWPRLIQRWKEAREGQKDFQVEFRLKHILEGKYRWFLNGTVPVFDDRGEIIRWYATCTDIDEQKQIEAEQREANRRKDEFLASLGHELRNPLPPIRNALEIMRLSGDNQEAVEKGRAMIERQLNQLIRLIEDLLDLSRLTRGKIRLRLDAVEISEILDDAVETSRPLLEAAQHQLTVIKPPGQVYFEGDGARLTQVIVNLLNNAAKYTDPKGEIIVSAAQEEDQIVLKVLDNGIGIASEILPNIFDIFTQSERTEQHSQGGLGVGLALVRGIVHLHGGAVKAQSPGPGKGSEFIVRLPMARPVSPTLYDSQDDTGKSHLPEATND